MSFCHQCGEQVASEDIFCPYCGISLAPIVPVDDASMSETIVGMPPPVPTPLTDPVTAAEVSPEKDDRVEMADETPLPVGESEPVAGDTAENWAVNTESIEIPKAEFDELQELALPKPVDLPVTPPSPFDEAPAADISDVPMPRIISEELGEVNAAVVENQVQDEPSDIEFIDSRHIVLEEEEETSVEPEVAPEPFVAEAASLPEPVPFEVFDDESVASVETPEAPTSESFESSAPVLSETEDLVPEKVPEMPEVSPVALTSVDDDLPEPSAFANVDEDLPEPFVAPEADEELPEPFVARDADEDLPEPFVAPEIEEVVATADVADVSTPEEPAPALEEPEKSELFDVFASPVELTSQTTADSDTGDAAEPEAPQPLEPEVFAEAVYQPEVPFQPVESVELEAPAELEKPAELEEPIAMPAMPLILESEKPATQLDSVQIIQKDIVVPEPPVAEKPAAETPVAHAEGRPYTTPNIGKSDTDGRRSAKLKPLDEGTILNSRYEIVRKIGGGGMGAVYLANDRNLGGVLRAVKEMVQSYIESEQQDKAIADFKRESLLLTSLDHPAIPTIYDYFFDEKEARFYLVMKYISGGDLAGRLRAAPEGRIDEKSVTEWAIQIADVLHYLHTHEPSIVYRDLKPANVMIDGNSGRVMLIDFGIARWVNKEEKGVTAVGTMGYAPPELFSGNVGPRSDIYSLGSTMFHLLTGADPQSNPLLIFDFQKHPRPRQINSQLSDQIEEILMRSVEYNSDARFNSAVEMRDALKDHLNNLLMGKVTYGVKAAPSNRAFSEQLVFCGFCGKQIVATDVFCAFCGAQQPIAQPGVSQSSIAVQPLTVKLTVMGTGELEPSSFKLEKNDNLLGRRDPMSNIFPEVDLSKFDPQTKISRRHARVWREGNSFLVEDLGSSNGTTLLPSASDAVRLLPHQPRTLTNGDKIRLGDTTLHFTIG